VGAYLGRKRWGVPDFLYAALDATAYAAFFKESRMKWAGATKLHRKSGVAPTIAFAEFPQIWLWIAKAFSRVYPLLLQHRLFRDSLAADPTCTFSVLPTVVPAISPIQMVA
jgi:hypothetical protein